MMPACLLHAQARACGVQWWSDRAKRRPASRGPRGFALSAALVAWFGLAGVGSAPAAPVDDLAAALTGAKGARSTVETTRDADGRVHVVIRGEHYDGRAFLRAFLRTFLAGLSADRAPGSAFDLDLDIDVGSLGGFDGELLRGVALRLSTQRGELVALALAGRIGVSDLRGELRRGRDGRGAVHLESGDAGALLRFLDLYQNVRQGRARIDVAVPGPDGGAQGVIVVDDFSIVGERVLKPLIVSARSGPAPEDAIGLSHLRLSFGLAPDEAALREGVAVGPAFGATVEGRIGFAANDIKLRGTIVPLFGLEQEMRKSSLHPPEELFSLSYTIEGPMPEPVLRLNNPGPLAPGLLRRLFMPMRNEGGE